MTRLAIVVEVENVIPEHQDPEEVAFEVIDHDRGYVPVIVSAEWSNDDDEV
jgi:hypothetical protein